MNYIFSFATWSVIQEHVLIILFNLHYYL